jgi:hypothetical protein
MPGVKKENLLRLIDRSIETEDRVVTQTSEDISSALDWCGCPPDERANVAQILSMIGNDSKRHAVVLTDLREKIKASETDKF